MSRSGALGGRAGRRSRCGSGCRPRGVFRSRSVLPPCRGGPGGISEPSRLVLGQVGRCRPSSDGPHLCPQVVHPCPGQWFGPAEAGDDAVPTLSDQVRGGFGEIRPEWPVRRSEDEACTVGNSGRLTLTRCSTCGSSGCPQVTAEVHRVFPRVLVTAVPRAARKVARFDPPPRQPVPLGGRTGVDRCRMSTPHPRGWAVPVEAGTLPRFPRDRRPLPDTRRSTREQAYVTSRTTVAVTRRTVSASGCAPARAAPSCPRAAARAARACPSEVRCDPCGPRADAGEPAHLEPAVRLGHPTRAPSRHPDARPAPRPSLLRSGPESGTAPRWGSWSARQWVRR